MNRGWSQVKILKAKADKAARDNKKAENY